MPHTYICPTIPQNLRKEETYVQIAEALNHLSNISEDIFRCVNTRINTNRDKLTSLSSRIQRAQAKVHRISTAKHAVQIFSSSKYPVVGIDERPYQSIFSPKSTLPMKRFDYQYKPVAQAQDEPLERLEFYHEPTLAISLVRLVGLGHVPGDTTFVGDLLFYNSGKNAYKQSVPLGDPLERPGRTAPRPTFDCTESNLGDAPQSITDKATDPLNHMRADSYFYIPDIGDVPTLDVPLDLPDLPGIAEDVHYITDKELGIAPSLQSKLTRNTTTDETAKTSPDSKLPTPMIHGSKTIAQETSPSYAAIETIAQRNVQELPDSLPDITAELSADVGDSTEVLPIPVFEPLNDPHTSLMEAIRKAAGGRNLRVANMPSPNASSGDLMTDLHTKLQMRRKGISGSKLSGSGETVMDKISGMIPPPTANASPKDPLTESGNTEEDEWED